MVAIIVRAQQHHLMQAIEGIIGVLAGLVVFAWPGRTARVLLYVIAFWANVRRRRIEKRAP